MSKYAFGDIAINSTEKKKPESSDKATYIGLEHLDSGNLTVRRFGADVAPIGDKLVMKKGDVLFGKRRAYQKKVAIAPFDGIFSAHGMVLRPKTEVVDKAFFPLFIASDYFLDAAIRISVGSLSPTINWRDLKVLEFSLPPLDEQRRLAKVLWAALDLKEAYQTMLARCDEMASSRFIELTKHAIKRQKITDCIKVLYGFPFDSRLFNSDCNGMPLIRIRDINTGFSSTYTTEVADEKYIVHKGECVIGMDGVFEVVKWAHQDAYLNQRVCKITPLSISKEYMIYCMRDAVKKIEELTPGTTVKHLSAKDINSIIIPIPDEDSQNLFAAFSLQLDKSKVALQKNIERLDILIKTLLQEHFG